MSFMYMEHETLQHTFTFSTNRLLNSHVPLCIEMVQRWLNVSGCGDTKPGSKAAIWACTVQPCSLQSLFFSDLFLNARNNR